MWLHWLLLLGELGRAGARSKNTRPDPRLKKRYVPAAPLRSFASSSLRSLQSSPKLAQEPASPKRANLTIITKSTTGHSLPIHPGRLRISSCSVA